MGGRYRMGGPSLRFMIFMILMTHGNVILDILEPYSFTELDPSITLYFYVIYLCVLHLTRLTHRSFIIFDILEPPAFQKHRICGMF